MRPKDHPNSMSLSQSDMPSRSGSRLAARRGFGSDRDGGGGAEAAAGATSGVGVGAGLDARAAAAALASRRAM
jgi:hypothetical protein